MAQLDPLIDGKLNGKPIDVSENQTTQNSRADHQLSAWRKNDPTVGVKHWHERMTILAGVIDAGMIRSCSLNTTHAVPLNEAGEVVFIEDDVAVEVFAAADDGVFGMLV